MLFLVSVIFSSIFLGKCIHQRQEFLLLMFLSFSPPPCLFGGVGVVCIWHLFSHVHTILGKKILKTSKQPRLVDDAIRGIQRKIKWGWRSSGSVLWGLGKIHRDKIRPDPDPELYTQPQADWELRKVSFQTNLCVVVYTETPPGAVGGVTIAR